MKCVCMKKDGTKCGSYPEHGKTKCKDHRNKKCSAVKKAGSAKPCKPSKPAKACKPCKPAKPCSAKKNITRAKPKTTAKKTTAKKTAAKKTSPILKAFKEEMALWKEEMISSSNAMTENMKLKEEIKDLKARLEKVVVVSV